MPTQTYCLRDDLEAVWSPLAVLRAADDDGDGALNAAEETHVARAIERAANRMNAYLETRYSLAQLAGNTWCRDCNAVLAVYLLATRRGNPPSDHVQRMHDEFLVDLDEIRAGRLKAPQADDSFETTPTVSNFHADLGPPRGKARRVAATSTGVPPPAHRQAYPETD